jgi:ribosome recycling factor
MELNIESVIAETNESMQHACEFLAKEFTKIRIGRANPQLLDGVKVDYYGSIVPLSQIASVTTPDPRTIFIKPWEKKMLHAIEKAIVASKIDIVPQNNGEIITINIPQLTEERRIVVVKQAKTDAEKCKVSVRNARKHSKEILKKLQKDGTPEDAIKKAEDQLQKTTDSFIEKIDSMLAAKEKDIMTI